MDDLVDLEEGEIYDETQRNSKESQLGDEAPLKDTDERKFSEIVCSTTTPNLVSLEEGVSTGEPVNNSSILKNNSTTEEENDFETLFVRGASPPPVASQEFVEHPKKSRRMLKPQICKFYYIGSCFKNRMCQYMHSEFPCKFYYLGLDCPQNDNCLFLHGKPLKNCMKSVLINHLEHAPQQFLVDLPKICRNKAIELINARDEDLKVQYDVVEEEIYESDTDKYVPPMKKKKTRWSQKENSAASDFGDFDMRSVNVPNATEFISFGNRDVDMRVLPDTTTSDSENIDGDKLIAQPLSSIDYTKNLDPYPNVADSDTDWDDDDDDGLKINLDETVKLQPPEDIEFVRVPFLQDLVPATVIDAAYNKLRPIVFQPSEIDIPPKDYSTIKRHLLSSNDPRMILLDATYVPNGSPFSPVRLRPNYHSEAQLPLEVFQSKWYGELSTTHKILVNHFICNLNKTREYDTQNIIPELQKLLAPQVGN